MPHARGFDAGLYYLGGTEDYYTHDHPNKCGGNTHVTDFWEHNSSYNGPARSSSHFPAYSASVFAQRAIEIIEEHDPSTPLFLLLSMQNAHEVSVATPLLYHIV